MDSCIHIEKAKANVKPNTPEGCEECLKLGDTWVHLRLCLTCGHVGCCDSSKNKHATKHFQATGHPVIWSFQPGEDWKWCYIDEIMQQSVDKPEVIRLTELQEEERSHRDTAELEKSRPHVAGEQTAAGSMSNPEHATSKTTLEKVKSMRTSKKPH